MHGEMRHQTGQTVFFLSATGKQETRMCHYPPPRITVYVFVRQPRVYPAHLGADCLSIYGAGSVEHSQHGTRSRL